MATQAQPILPSKVIRAEYGRTIYTATLENGASKSDIERSDFWVHLAPQLQKLDRIEIVTEDGDHFYEMMVARVDIDTSTQRSVRTPQMVVLQDVALGATKKASPKEAAKPDPVEDEVPEGYRVEYGGPKYKYRVIQDGVVDPIADGMSKKDAIAWAVERAGK